MKAEERKELETNILANKLGRFVQGAKKGPSRRGFLVFVALAIVAVAGIIFMQVRSSQNKATAKGWKDFLLGQPVVKGSEQDKLARMRVAHQLMWQEGIAKLLLPNQQKTALEAIEDAQVKYTEAARVYKDDPLLGGEANFHLGLIQEILSVKDPANIDDSFKQAVQHYEKAAKEWKADTPLGKMARDRIATLQYSVSDETIKNLKKQYSIEKAIAAEPGDQNELETVIKLLKPLADKSYDSSNALSEAIRTALAKGDELSEAAQTKWQSKILIQARNRRMEAATIYQMVADWSRRPAFDPRMGGFNPHMNIPGFGKGGMPFGEP